MNRARVALLAACAAIGAGLLWNSQTLSFSWDEGFHLVAAQLIAHGRRPYLDFCFAQAPLNAFWNAIWMRLIAESWRLVHALAALESALAIFLAADFVFSRWIASRWRFSAALVAAMLCGLNPQVIRYGEVGQAYGLCLLLSVAAFRAAVIAREREGLRWAGAAGFLSAAAAGSSLLTGPVGPVIVAWLLLANRAGNRWRKAMAAILGAIVAWSPVLWLLAHNPRVVLFDIFRYHIFYRRSDWPGATEHDLGVYRSIFTSPPALLIALLAAAGLWFILRSPDWCERRAEVLLAVAIATALTLFISTAHPTFERYYLLATPFLAIPAAIGLFEIAKRTGALERPWWPVATVGVILGATLVFQIKEWREEMHWGDIEPLARQVDEVSAPNARLYVDEHVAFLTRRTPIEGNEYLSSHKLRLPEELARAVHIIPEPKWDRRIAEREFDTIQTCEGEDWIKEWSLPAIYRSRADISDCSVFWDPIRVAK